MLISSIFLKLSANDHTFVFFLNQLLLFTLCSFDLSSSYGGSNGILKNIFLDTIQQPSMISSLKNWMPFRGRCVFYCSLEKDKNKKGQKQKCFQLKSVNKVSFIWKLFKGIFAPNRLSIWMFWDKTMHLNSSKFYYLIQFQIKNWILNQIALFNSIETHVFPSLFLNN